MRHTKIAKSRRHKKFKAVDDKPSDDYMLQNEVKLNNLSDQSIPRKWQQILDLKQQNSQTKRKRNKNTNNQLIIVRTQSEPIEKGMTRSDKELPQVIEQGLYESEGHFLSRLAKLSAKAKAEATIEDRFDVDFCKKLDTNDNENNDKTEDVPKKMSNKRLKQKAKQKAKQIAKKERNARKRPKNGKEDSFEGLKDSIAFGERVSEPPLLSSFRFKRKTQQKINK